MRWASDMNLIRSIIHMLWMAVTVVPWAIAVLIFSLFGSSTRVYWLCAGWLRLAVTGGTVILGIQMRLAACAASGLQVTHRVTGGWHTFERHAESAANLLKQTRQGLAAITLLFRAVRAIKHRVHPAPHSGQHFVHLGMHRVQRGHIKQAAPQA